MGYEEGATMHVCCFFYNSLLNFYLPFFQLDFINRLMWQAQLKGSKTWHLRPSPECEHVCEALDFLVEPGDAGK